ncbi:MAG TPA: hypothetical protein VII47_07830, partial [Actinomycetota bacterium]
AGASPAGRPQAPTPVRNIEEEIADSDPDEEGEEAGGRPVQPVTTGHGSAVDLVKQGFGAEVVEEF